MASNTPPNETQAQRAHEEPELAAKPNGNAALAIKSRLPQADKLNVGAQPRKPKAKRPVTTPKDCPILNSEIIPPRPSLTSTTWFWPLLFTITCVVFAAGTWSGRIVTQDDGRAAVISELKANDAALASRIESVAMDRNRDSERLARLEVIVQSIDKNLQSLIEVSRPKPRAN